jgi:hypothetical protein
MSQFGDAVYSLLDQVALPPFPSRQSDRRDHFKKKETFHAHLPTKSRSLTPKWLGGREKSRNPQGRENLLPYQSPIKGHG